jgi:hypothetical protein
VLEKSPKELSVIIASSQGPRVLNELKAEYLVYIKNKKPEVEVELTSIYGQPVSQEGNMLIYKVD